MQPRKILALLLAPFILLVSPLVLAHSGGGHVAGLADGFMHPVTGLDHLLIAIAAGFWAGRSGDHCCWVSSLCSSRNCSCRRCWWWV